MNPESADSINNPQLDQERAHFHLPSTSTIQSSIIKPALRSSDLKYATLKLIGESNSNRFLNSFELGENSDAFLQGSAMDFLINDFKRSVLRFMRYVFSLWLQLLAIVNYVQLVVNSQFWWFVLLLNIFPQDIIKSSNVGTASSLQDTISQNSNKSKLQNYLGSSRFMKLFNRLSYFPTRIGNHALKASLSNAIPKDQLTIKQAIGHSNLPQHLVSIYCLAPLVVPPAPELPTPYLTAEKKLVVPDKKETTRVLAQRAEWAAAHHTHKAAEIMRVCTEVSKLITWTAYSGIKSLTIYESNGYAWKDLSRLGSMVQSEMASLNNGDSDTRTWIKLVNLNLSTSTVIGSSTVENHLEANYDNVRKENANPQSALATVDPTPVSANIVSSTLIQEDESCMSYGDLTVILVSQQDGKVKLCETVKNFLNENNPSSSIDSLITKELSKLEAPDLILNFSSPRDNPNSLHGFPIYNFENEPLLITTAGQTTFPFFVNGIRYYSSQLHS